METYKLESTGLELAGHRLTKRNKEGGVEATFDARKIRRATVAEGWDTVGIAISLSVFCLGIVFFRYLPDGIWRWIAVIGTSITFLLCLFGIKSRSIVIEIGEDRIQYSAVDLPDQIASFVAMINQARSEESCNESADL